MPQFAEIALKLTANVRDAVRGIETVDRALDKTDKKLRAMQARSRARLDRAGQLGSDLLTGRSLESTVEGAIPQTGVAAIAGAIVLAAQRGLEKFMAQATEKMAAQLGLATSGPEAGRAFAGVVGASAEAASVGESPFVQLWHQVRGDSNFERKARDEFRKVAESDPYLAASILANLPPSLESSRGDLEQILKQTRSKNVQAEKAASFRESLRPSRSGATVVQSTTNVYSSFAGVGGESNVGREVRAVLDRRDRNNGRYVTTFNRRG